MPVSFLYSAQAGADRHADARSQCHTPGKIANEQTQSKANGHSLNHGQPLFWPHAWPPPADAGFWRSLSLPLNKVKANTAAVIPVTIPHTANRFTNPIRSMS
jgi:hypothetical protein